MEEGVGRARGRGRGVGNFGALAGYSLLGSGCDDRTAGAGTRIDCPGFRTQSDDAQMRTAAGDLTLALSSLGRAGSRFSA
jgi:hypothetical protein